MIQTDETDEAIIRLLQVDGRMSNREVARQLDLSEGTVRQRLKRLQETKAIRLGAVVDAVRIGLTFSCYLQIVAAAPKLRKVAKTIAELEAAAFVGITLGEHNLIVMVNARARDDLANIIQNQITPIDGVLHVDAFELISNYKHRYDIVRIR